MSIQSIVDAKNNHIDKLVAEFEKEFSRLVKGMRGELGALFKSGDFTHANIEAIFKNRGFDQLSIEFVDKYDELFKYGNQLSAELGHPALSKLLTEKSLGLLEKAKIATISEFSNSRSAIINSMYRAGFEAEVQGASFKSIVADLTKSIDDVGRRVGTEAFTGISIFDQTVRAEQLNNAGIDRYIYMGPYDGKNRTACRDVLSHSKQQTGWTMADIQSIANGFGVSFIGRGGYNCRHEWMAFVPEVAPEKIVED